MIFFVKLKLTLNGTQAIVPHQASAHFSVRTSNGKQLVKIPYSKANAIHVCENGRSRLANFHEYTILKIVAMEDFRFSLPFFLLPLHIAEQEFFQKTFVAGGSMYFAQFFEKVHGSLDRD